ncbi:dethiobiotin synthase [Chenggangzhangella methanolivorans]|uniref:ATP-dependent dethiobiotin synthetase BioD n=1 Tax=Chenggangzhangella methanolivorans TaxID=1437009 RepID=A0A9E6UL23_9HYPH|nr:dethiobiotin synthase [Chenggangzhangella methanolivorans]QZN98500.1 dethiobiotin synthase [Chenggangzhangella methanolivorans]
MSAIVVTGTDTGIGKTVFAAGLTAALGATYWKPVQSGLEGETDSETVARLARLPPERVLPEAWRLRTPASPHLAAEIDGVAIDPEALNPPAVNGPLVIEGAGGLFVPLTRETLTIDVFARWRLPVVLVARTALGTINHTLLSLSALKARGIPVLGVAFVGEENVDSIRAIATFSGARVLGRLPPLAPLSPRTLAEAFGKAFRTRDFIA